MKKHFFFFGLLLATGTTNVYADRGIGEVTRTTDPSIVINGVRWATRNVDMPNTFSENPESLGMLYQWNRKIAWSNTDPLMSSRGSTVWNASNPTGTEWEKTNNPCPQGWRVPTHAEIQALGNTNYVTSEWTNINDTYGRRFTDLATGNNIFLPAVGWRFVPNGSLLNANWNGAYWSSTSDGAIYAWSLVFSIGVLTVGNSNFSRADGFSVRCVAE